MSLISITLLFAVFIILVLLTAIRPKAGQYSRFELTRRSNMGDEEAIRDLKRSDMLIDILSLQRVLSALFLVLFVLLSVAWSGWFVGIVMAVVVALEYGQFARISFVRLLAQKVYNRLEPYAIKLVEKASVVFKLIRNVPASDMMQSSRIDSRQELQHLIDESPGVLSPDERKLIVHGLSFGDKLVSSIMTPRSVIDSIKAEEFLGPLTLDGLHKSGHSRLPVTDGDIDHVVGILYLSSLLALDIKKSTTARKAMDPKVFYIRQDQTLQHALAAFLRTRHHMFIVVNEFRETVGLITLEDVVEALLGRKIIDEFDAHDDLRQVALRNPRGNNHPDKREDV